MANRMDYWLDQLDTVITDSGVADLARRTETSRRPPRRNPLRAWLDRRRAAALDRNAA